jgi:hypothetical protein
MAQNIQNTINNTIQPPTSKRKQWQVAKQYQQDNLHSDQHNKHKTQ